MKVDEKTIYATDVIDNKINIEMEENSMRETARGLLVMKNGLVLIHRIKQKNGIRQEYYVVPGGGIEDGEENEKNPQRQYRNAVCNVTDFSSSAVSFLFHADDGNI